ncbi:Cof-type HAD-IIB family hydrolase [Anthocerotibacter panamensis]|uniref:Cof-type HAD-IIB family hydrolase n=1 Tax=Anthocerotibacter panamensis TaxID=2857077 RepID=UPI001C4066A6|nr:Cof-type HAD-IIB family hydrolase [Anthocerotibacter panamensis]
MGIRLVALDLDGTLLGADGIVSPMVAADLRELQQRGVAVAVVTGRMYRAALPYHHQIQATLPLCSYQGALIKDPQTGTVHRHQLISRTLAHDLLTVFQGHGLPVQVYLNDTLYVQGPAQPQSLRYSQRTGVPLTPVDDLRAVLNADPTKLLAFCDQALESMWADLKDRYSPDEIYLTRSTDFFIEALHPQINKGTAVAYLAEEILGIGPEQVMSIGDYFNDLEMIRYAGVGVAMGSAPLPVQQVAAWVAPTVEEDGVSAALHRFVLDV